jgi:hypothetical protein
MDHELDSGDLDAIRELRGLRGYTLLFIRISDQIKLRVAKLEQLLPLDETNVLRGEIAGLKLALEIPQILEDEARVNVESAPLQRYVKEKPHGR